MKDPPRMNRLLCSMDQAYGLSKWYLLASLASALLGIVFLAVLYLMRLRLLGALSALALQCLAFFLKRKFQRQYRKGHEFERAAILLHSLDEPSDLETIYKDARLQRRSPQYAAYFHSTGKHGGRLLLEDLAECSFFTKHVAETTHLLFQLLVYAGTAVIVFAVFAAIVEYREPFFHPLPRWSSETVNVAVEVAFLALAFIAAGDIAFASSQYGFLARKMKSVYLAASAALASGKDDPSLALVLLLDYSCLLMEAPPIFVSGRKREQLNRKWREEAAAFAEVQSSAGG
jgi:hypothetical protein